MAWSISVEFSTSLEIQKKEEKVWNESTSHLESFQNVLRRGSTPPAKHLKPIPIEMAKKGISQSFRKWAKSFPSNSRRNENSKKKKKDKQKFKTFLAVILTSHLSCFSFLGIFRQTKGKCCKRISKKKKKKKSEDGRWPCAALAGWYWKEVGHFPNRRHIHTAHTTKGRIRNASLVGVIVVVVRGSSHRWWLSWW